jgi:hypothetical protein
MRGIHDRKIGWSRHALEALDLALPWWQSRPAPTGHVDRRPWRQAKRKHRKR